MLGSALRMAAIACWWRAIESNEIPSTASVWPQSCPMSWEGMNPFGTTMKSTPITIVTASVITIIVRRWASDQESPAL